MTWLLMIGGLLGFAWGLHDVMPDLRNKKGHYPLALKTAKWFVAVGLIGFFVGVGMYANSRSPASPGATATAAPAHSPVEAWTICQEFVADRLVAPRSAKYPIQSLSEFVAYKGLGAYRVENYVDAQNTYGAMIRTRFTCEVTKEPTRWRLDSLVLK